MIEERVVKANVEEISACRYDVFNQLVEVRNPQGTTTFTYYPSGLRETKTYGGEVTKYYYDGQNVILEETNSILSARNIYGNGAGPAVRENYDAAGNKNNYFYIYNGHGDVAALVDESCYVISDYEYNIYGETLQPYGTIVDNPFRYAGQYYDKETGLYYLRARYYDPSGHTGELAAAWFGSMLWLLPADGLLPIGDAIYAIGGGLIYVGEVLMTYGPQHKKVDTYPGIIMLSTFPSSMM